MLETQMSRIFFPGCPVQLGVHFGADTGVLFEKERYVLINARIANCSRPFSLHRPVSRPTLTTNNRPMNTVKVQGFNRANQRFKRNEPRLGSALTQVVNSANYAFVFNARSHPYVVSPRAFPLCGSLRALGEDLECVLRQIVHDIKHRRNELVWDQLVEQIAHRIDKHCSRFAPRIRLVQSFGVQRDIEVCIRLRPRFRRAMESCVEKMLRVTVSAALADLRATGYWIPRFLCPTNDRTHDGSFLNGDATVKRPSWGALAVIWIGYNGVAWHDPSCGATSGDGANIARTSHTPLYKTKHQKGIAITASRPHRVLRKLLIPSNLFVSCTALHETYGVKS